MSLTFSPSSSSGSSGTPFSIAIIPGAFVSTLCACGAPSMVAFPGLYCPLLPPPLLFFGPAASLFAFACAASAALFSFACAVASAASAALFALASALFCFSARFSACLFASLLACLDTFGCTCPSPLPSSPTPTTRPPPSSGTASPFTVDQSRAWRAWRLSLELLVEPLSSLP